MVEIPPGLKYTHTRLLVSDYRECFRFYRDVLGFDVSWGDIDRGYADFETGQTTIALFGRRAMADAIGTDSLPAETDHQDTVALTFEVDDVDETIDRLRDAAEIVTEPQNMELWGVRVAHFRDPGGTLIEVNRPLEDATAE